MGSWIPLVGMTTLIALGVVLSKDRRAIHLRTVGAAFALLVSVAALVLFVPQGKAMLHTAGAGVQWVINYSYSGISFLFGDLATDKVGFVFALRVLPIIIFFSALMAVLYHIGIMQWVVRVIGGTFQRIIGTRRVESFCAAANIFVSQAEAPLVLRQAGDEGRQPSLVERHGPGHGHHVAERPGAHRRQVGEVDRKQSLGHDGGVEIWREMDPGYLLVDGYGRGGTGAKDSCVVADEVFAKTHQASA